MRVIPEELNNGEVVAPKVRNTPRKVNMNSGRAMQPLAFSVIHSFLQGTTMYHNHHIMLRSYLFLAVTLIANGSGPQPLGAAVRVRHTAAREVHEPVAGAVVPGTVIVKFKSDAPETSGTPGKAGITLSPSLTRMGVTSMRSMFPRTSPLEKAPPSSDLAGLSRVYTLTLRDALDPVAVARQIAGLPGVEYAEPKYYQRLYAEPNDPLLVNQADALTRMNAYAGWNIARGSGAVVIADVDGGTDWQHEDLLANVHVNPGEDLIHNGVFDSGDLNGLDDDGNGYVDDIVGWNFTNNTYDPTGVGTAPGSYAHGTATASHFGAVTDNGKGMAGSSWNCGMMPVCAASVTGDNLISFGYEGIVYAYQNGASIINCSWGRPGGYSQFEQDVITAATAAGALVVAAAGNESSNNDLAAHYPSNYTGVLGVGATFATDDVVAPFSNFGKLVQVFAPGVNIFSAIAGGGYGNGRSGTSYSSPYAAGLAGILRTAHPAWTPVQIAAQIRTTADPIGSLNPTYAGSLGRGRVNFERALTESHAALDLTTGDLRTTGAQKLFLPGDTLVLSMRLKNVLFIPATNCQIAVTTSDPSLEVLNGVAVLSAVSPGEEADVPLMMFRVGSLDRVREVALRVVWTYNGTEQDGAVFRAMLFPAVPLWVLQRDGSSASLFSTRAVSKDVIWASGGNGSASSPLVLRSTDGGGTWEDATGSLQNVDLFCIDALDAQRAWVGTSDGRIFATADGGSTWTAQAYPGRQTPFMNAVKLFPDGTGYALGDPPNDGKFLVLKTQDFGNTWVHLANEPGLSTSEAGWNNSFWWSDAQHGWFGTNMNRVWLTTDGGDTWSSAATGSSNSFGVAFNGTTTGYAVHDNGFVARSTDGGQSWSPVSLSTTEQVAAAACVPGTSSAWVATGSEPFRTRDDGVNWTAETLYPFSGSITHVSIADTTVGWAVTSHGEILRYDPSAVTGAPEPPVAGVPAEYSLEQNYPNPFNPTTTIRFSIVEPQFTTLNVYDVLGREVAVLVHEWKAPGTYQVVFDGTGLASGVYYYRLQIQDERGAGWRSVAARKMVFTK